MKVASSNLLICFYVHVCVCVCFVSAADSSGQRGSHCEGSRCRWRHDQLHHRSVIGKVEQRPVHVLLFTSFICVTCHLFHITCDLFPVAWRMVLQDRSTEQRKHSSEQTSGLWDQNSPAGDRLGPGNARSPVRWTRAATHMTSADLWFKEKQLSLTWKLFKTS